MDLSNRYDKYTPYVQEVIKYLIKDVDLHENYILSLDLIADNLEMYFRSKNDILTNGFAIVNERNQTVKNPSVQVMNSTQQMLVKLLASFPSSPMSKGKLEKLNLMTDFEVDNLDEFL